MPDLAYQNMSTKSLSCDVLFTSISSYKCSLDEGSYVSATRAVFTSPVSVLSFSEAKSLQ